MKKIKILFTGGGTGGHIFPIIAVAREIRKVYSDEELNLFYAGPKDELSQVLFPQEGIKIKRIWAGKLRRYFGEKAFFYNIIDLFKTFFGIFQSFFYLFFLNPDIIFSKGGYGAFPVSIAGILLGIPVFLHESDIVPGLSNRIIAHFSSEIFVSFPKTRIFPLKKILVVGNPIREELLNGSTERAKEVFNIRGRKPIIFIIGGSQGAQKINDVVLNILNELLLDFEVIHQTGIKNFAAVKRESEVIIPSELKAFYHPFPFLKEPDLRDAFKIADLVVSRAGSGLIFEIAALGKPSILIPLAKSAQDHQLKNAYAYAQNGACIVIEEGNFTPHFFLEKLKQLFDRPSKLEKMKEGAKIFARSKAAKIIAYYLKEYLEQK